jgi:uncharacterized protein YdhG (YjbR/CyaY superfamily)
MDSKTPAFNSIDEYIVTFPEDVQRILREVRATIKAAAPDAKEKISYGMPAFAQNGNLVYFAAWKNHLGFYPGSAAVVQSVFKDELDGYPQTKGSIHFPFDQPMPLDLIGRIVQFRITENQQIAAQKAEKKKQKS